MNDFLPRGFVESERRRILQPDESFARRVISRTKPVSGLAVPMWDYVQGFARPMVVVLTAVLVVILGLHLIYPQPPVIGIVDAYLESDAELGDDWLYRDAGLPQGDDLLLEISLVEGLE